MKKLLFLVVSCILFSSAAAQDLQLTGWPYEVDVVRENLVRFGEQYELEATFDPFPSNEYHDKMVSSFVGGTDFDVVYVRDSFLAEWAAAGWIVPITDMPGVDEYLADLPQGIIEQMSYNGEVYGLPYYSGTNVFAYNSDHLAQAGIEAPPTSWEEMLSQAQALKDAGVSEHPILLELRRGENYIIRTLEIITAAFGGKLFNDDLEPLFQEENSAAKQALAWLREGLESGLIAEASLSVEEASETMMSGAHSFTLTTDYTLKAMNDPDQSNVAGDMMNAMIPGANGAESGTIGYVRLYAITADAEDKDAAWQLVQFLGGRDATGEYYVPKRWALEYGLGFSPAPLYEDEEVRGSIAGWIDPDLLQQQANYAITRPYRFVPFFSDWETEAWAEFQEVLGGADADAILDSLAEDWNELKEEYGY